MKKLTAGLVLTAAMMLCGGCVRENLVMDGKDSFHPVKELDRQNAATHRVKIAIHLLDEGQATLAKENLEKALELDPDNYDAKLAYAWYYQTVGETENAYKAYNSLVNSYQDMGDVFHNYGIFLCTQNKYSEAYGMFERAVTISKYTRVAETYAEAGRCAYKQGDDKRAISYLDRSLRYNSNNPYALGFRAELALGVGDLKTARDMINRYSHFAAENAFTLFTKLRIEEGSGNSAQAKIYGQELVSRYPDSVEAKKYLSNNY
ncbi:MAG: type IV pilus biogenesis/stability protein PilW [Succinivibrionaceae bacterium]|nr:type IV pilus biogenesis/stability protein PilW [Succinivibrionaceae bacterium]